MFNKISKTQSANYVALIMFVIQLFNLNVAETEVGTVVTGVLGIIAVAVSWYERYRRGDLTITGARKR